MSAALVIALVAARKAVSPTVHKGGNNSAQNYKYVGHEHVLVSGARQALLDNGLVLEQQAVELCGTFENVTRNGTNTVLRWKGTHVLLHESGESRTYVFEATTQANDKAAFVASTALDRTAHMRVLELAGSAEENPEHDSHDKRERFDERRREKAQAEQRQSQRSEPSRAQGDAQRQQRQAPRASAEPASAPSKDEYGIPVPRTPCPMFSPRTPEQLRGKRWDVKEGGWLIAQWYEDASTRAQMTPPLVEWAEYCLERRRRRHEIEEAEAAERALHSAAAPAAGG